MSLHFVEHRRTGRAATIVEFSNWFVRVRLHHKDATELWRRSECVAYPNRATQLDVRNMGGSLNRAADAFEALRQEMRASQ